MSTVVESSRTAVQAGVARLQAVPPRSWLKVGVVVALIGLSAVAVALHDELPGSDARPAPAHASRHHAAAVAPEVALHAPAASHAAPKAAEPKADARGSAESYATAARKGDRRALNKLIAMTHANTCSARSEAADALATVRGPKATAALKKLSHAKFRDESKSPGIFSCSSRRAAQKALAKRGDA